jgi:hypothetical protein
MMKGDRISKFPPLEKGMMEWASPLENAAKSGS